MKWKLEWLNMWEGGQAIIAWLNSWAYLEKMKNDHHQDINGNR